MNEPAAVFDNQQDFLVALDTGSDACWQVQAGITLSFSAASARQGGLILTLAPARCYPGLLRQVLQRRFLEADALCMCGLSLDDQQHLRLHRALPARHDPIGAINALWCLAGLPPR
ncbi:type III secretion protein [Samsonia erythrinae]|uniref:Uncharacterized protein n=1 Tax=Samsonia erythrinae TaxID=160434 RepID=A0A4R3VIX1_9GAMM|nr:type III secretion protein [Samsonia erythrinae]TCV05751.1 hypothetical protein EDC54_10517 [Samsonia erythrinae]